MCKLYLVYLCILLVCAHGIYCTTQALDLAWQSFTAPRVSFVTLSWSERAKKPLLTGAELREWGVAGNIIHSMGSFPHSLRLAPVRNWKFRPFGIFGALHSHGGSPRSGWFTILHWNLLLKLKLWGVPPLWEISIRKGKTMKFHGLMLACWRV